jgi:hypothetical protein
MLKEDLDGDTGQMAVCTCDEDEAVAWYHSHLDQFPSRVIALVTRSSKVCQIGDRRHAGAV